MGRLLVVLLLLLLPLGVAPTSDPASDLAADRQPVARHAGHEPSLEVGVTHTQRTADYGRPTAVRRARAILRTLGPLQAQHLMGFGALNPEPRPGVHRWASLDVRMRLIARTGGEPVLTLCCAPDWMKGGRPGTTDWSRLEEAPLPRFYDDFARLAAAAVRRYPQVRRVQVWNELKGFYDPARNRWDIAAYTRLYNRVYRAVKAVDPRIRVGGPYVPMDSWHAPDAGGFPSAVRGAWGVLDQRSLDAVRYWLRHRAGADFVVVDGGTDTKDGYQPPSGAGAQKLADVDRWLRARTRLPIWWAEVYPRRNPHAMRLALRALDRSGASVAMLWQPECGGGFACVWTSTKRRDGGRATPHTGLIRSYARG